MLRTTPIYTILHTSKQMKSNREKKFNLKYKKKKKKKKSSEVRKRTQITGIIKYTLKQKWK